MKNKISIGYYIATTLILLLSMFLGMLISLLSPSFTLEILSQLEEEFGALADATSLEIFSFIFFNNLFINFLAVASFFLFGLVPLFILASNGIVIGVVLGIAATKASIGQLSAALLPHGIIELPTFIFSSSLGIWLSVQLAKKILIGTPFKPAITYATQSFLKVILPLTLTAAFIETYITPLFMGE